VCPPTKSALVARAAFHLQAYPLAGARAYVVCQLTKGANARPAQSIPTPVTYAIDPKRSLSPTPSTPIGDVGGVADRIPNLSVA
jgi:hypothetical protein